MDFSGSLRYHQVLGAIMAAAIAHCCHGVGGLVVSHRLLRVWKDCRSRCIRCVWIESVESTPGDTRAHRHAAGISDLSNRPAGLEKNRRAGGMEAARSNSPLRLANNLNVNQRPDRLRLLASRHWSV